MPGVARSHPPKTRRAGLRGAVGPVPPDVPQGCNGGRDALRRRDPMSLGAIDARRAAAQAFASASDPYPSAWRGLPSPSADVLPTRAGRAIPRRSPGVSFRSPAARSEARRPVTGPRLPRPATADTCLTAAATPRGAPPASFMPANDSRLYARRSRRPLAPSRPPPPGLSSRPPQAVHRRPAPRLPKRAASDARLTPTWPSAARRRRPICPPMAHASRPPQQATSGTFPDTPPDPPSRAPHAVYRRPAPGARRRAGRGRRLPHRAPAHPRDLPPGAPLGHAAGTPKLPPPRGCVHKRPLVPPDPCARGTRHPPRRRRATAPATARQRPRTAGPPPGRAQSGNVRRPSPSSGKPGLWAISQTWPSGSAT